MSKIPGQVGYPPQTQGSQPSAAGAGGSYYPYSFPYNYYGYGSNPGYSYNPYDTSQQGQSAGSGVTGSAQVFNNPMYSPFYTNQTQKDAKPPGMAPYKVVDCRHFALHGHCARGDTCGFKHGPMDGSGNSSATPASGPPGTIVPSAGSSNATPCKHFSKSATCPLASLCKFLHVIPTPQQQQQQAQVPPSTPYKVVPCRHWTKNFQCPRGDTCGFIHENPSTLLASYQYNSMLQSMQNPLAMPLHVPIPIPVPTPPAPQAPVPFRTVTCRRWLSGQCNLGDSCTFLHAQAQPGTPSLSSAGPVQGQSQIQGQSQSQASPTPAPVPAPAPATNNNTTTEKRTFQNMNEQLNNEDPEKPQNEDPDEGDGDPTEKKQRIV